MAFKDSLERIQQETGAKTQVELSKILGISQGSISEAKKRNSVPAEWLIRLCKSHRLNPLYIESGQEPKYIIRADSAPSSNRHSLGINENIVQERSRDLGDDIEILDVNLLRWAINFVSNFVQKEEISASNEEISDAIANIYKLKKTEIVQDDVVKYALRFYFLAKNPES